MDWTEFIIEQFATPGKLVGHLSYMLLVGSMLMRSMKWLRIIALSAGFVSAIYGYFWLKDFVTVFWEVVFVTTNLVQLLLLEWANKRAKFSDDEQRFVKTALPHVERAHARTMLKLASWKSYDAGEILTSENSKVDNLLFILEGAVRIDKDGAMVGVCGHEDFLGEIGFMSGEGATATSIVVNPVRCLSFEREGLMKMMERYPEIRHSMEASFNRSLVSKLVKSNDGARRPQVSFEAE